MADWRHTPAGPWLKPDGFGERTHQARLALEEAILTGKPLTIGQQQELYRLLSELSLAHVQLVASTRLLLQAV